MKESKRGGPGRGQGRKKLPSDQKKKTVVKRIPVEIESQVDELVFSFRIGKKK